jgi:hypothetical protein
MVRIVEFLFRKELCFEFEALGELTTKGTRSGDVTSCTPVEIHINYRAFQF